MRRTESAGQSGGVGGHSTGTFGAQQTYYGDFRGQRRPAESMSFGKRFTFGENSRKSLTVRAEFFNVFNRMVSLPDP